LNIIINKNLFIAAKGRRKIAIKYTFRLDLMTIKFKSNKLKEELVNSKKKAIAN
jgi:hypothetical protein